MRFTRLGRTGLRISEIGFGAWGIGNGAWAGGRDDSSSAALKVARDAGINFFDTALVYGHGHSERLISRVLGNTDEIVVASKVPPMNEKWPARRRSKFRDIFPRAYVLQSLDSTLTNLRRESIDLYQFHVWTDEWANDPDWHETVRAILRSGKVRFIGISINDHQPDNVLKSLDTGLVDAVQVIYNIFEQSPRKHLFSACHDRDIGVIARAPLDEGGLTGTVCPETTFPAGDFRNGYFAGDRKEQVWRRVQRLANDAGIELSELPALALRFCLSHPVVSTVIPGMRTTHHVRQNIAAADEGALPPELLAILRSHAWKKNYYRPFNGDMRWLKNAASRYGNRMIKSLFGMPRAAKS